jgi:hypothetical protein
LEEDCKKNSAIVFDEMLHHICTWCHIRWSYGIIMILKALRRNCGPGVRLAVQVKRQWTDIFN